MNSLRSTLSKKKTNDLEENYKVRLSKTLSIISWDLAVINMYTQFLTYNLNPSTKFVFNFVLAYFSCK